jgi:RNA polymerase sigma-70 factor (ECF subfamily)
MADSRVAGGFPTTCWSRVTRAADPADPDARAALEGLCGDYWYPLYAFVRRRGLGPDDVSDIVQGFLADLLERNSLVSVHRDRGRFRAFLRASCAHYLAHERDRDRALKRGGGWRVIPIVLVDAEGRYGCEPSHERTADWLFERRWALVLLEHVLARLGAEAAAAGKAELFARLRPLLEGGDGVESYRQIGQALGIGEGAVKVAAHRLRSRYRDLLRDEVARTVADPDQVDAELADLIAALAG